MEWCYNEVTEVNLIMADQMEACMFFLEMDMRITGEDKGWYDILIQCGDDRCTICYSPLEKALTFPEDGDDFSHFLQDHRYQLSKILHNKRLDSYYVGFELTFILWKDKDVAAFNDMENLVVLDRRNGDYRCYTTEKDPEDVIDEVYIDGSYLEKKKHGGYAILHKDLEGEYHLHSFKTKEKGSNRVELTAAIEALKLFDHLEKIRLITDSQYVRKGLSEWLLCWERNGYMTSNGEKVKNIDKWHEAYSQTCNRYIELEWVKAHRDHFENTIVDLYARDSASGIKRGR